MSRKNRFEWIGDKKEKRDKQQGQSKGADMPRGPRLDARPPRLSSRWRAGSPGHCII